MSWRLPRRAAASACHRPVQGQRLAKKRNYLANKGRLPGLTWAHGSHRTQQQPAVHRRVPPPVSTVTEHMLQQSSPICSSRIAGHRRRWLASPRGCGCRMTQRSKRCSVSVAMSPETTGTIGAHVVSTRRRLADMLASRIACHTPLPFDGCRALEK